MATKNPQNPKSKKWVINTRTDLADWMREHRGAMEPPMGVKKLSKALGLSNAMCTIWELEKSLPIRSDVEKMAQIFGAAMPEVNLSLREHRGISSSTPRMLNTNIEKKLGIPAEYTVAHDLYVTALNASMDKGPVIADRIARVFCAVIVSGTLPAVVARKIGANVNFPRYCISRVEEKLAKGHCQTKTIEALRRKLKKHAAFPMRDRLNLAEPMMGRNVDINSATRWIKAHLGIELDLQATKAGDTSPVAILAREFARRGIVHFELFYARAARSESTWMSPDSLVKELAATPGFKWLGENQTWFTLGDRACKSQIARVVLECLAAADGPVKIATILGAYEKLNSLNEGAFAVGPVDNETIKLVAQLLPEVALVQDTVWPTAPLGIERIDNERNRLMLEIVRELGGAATKRELLRAISESTGATEKTASLWLRRNYLMQRVFGNVFTVRGVEPAIPVMIRAIKSYAQDDRLGPKPPGKRRRRKRNRHNSLMTSSSE